MPLSAPFAGRQFRHSIHAAAATPIIATQTIGAMRRTNLFPAIVVIRLKYLILLDNLMKDYDNGRLPDHSVRKKIGTADGAARNSRWSPKHIALRQSDMFRKSRRDIAPSMHI